MKKIISVILVCVLGAAILNGCASTSSASQKNILENKIADLEQEIAQLKNQTDETERETEKETEVSQEIPQEITEEFSEPSTENLTAESTYTPSSSLEELASIIETAVTKVKEAVPAGSAEEQKNQFITLKSELQQAEDMLDLYEDELERAYWSKEVTKEQYRTEDRELEALEERLDFAEDDLEVLFGIDD